MEYAEHAPVPPLAPHVKCLWTLRGPAARGPGGPPPDRILPDGCGEVVLNRADRFREHLASGVARVQPDALLVAQLDGPIRIAPTGDVDLIGIRFRPGGLFPFLRLDVDGIRGTALDLGDVASDLRRALREAAEGGRDPVLAVQRVLVGRLDRLPREPDGIVGAAVRRLSGGAARVADLGARLGVGERQLLRRFRREVGLPPKVLAAILRFQRAVAIAPQGAFSREGGRGEGVSSSPRETRADWAGIAAACGYSDQAHLVREFRRFAGLPPAAYFRERTELSAVFVGMSDSFNPGGDEPATIAASEPGGKE